MGFQIEIKGQDLKRIRDYFEQDPADLFRKPYGGYLLFLAGIGDEKVFSWLSKNIIALDSLTSNNVAFAVFTYNFEIEVQQGNYIYWVKKLVQSGKSILGFTSDESIAITYGTDEVARSFDVLGDLPCMLVFDSIPKQTFKVFHLNQGNLQALLLILRRSIQSFMNLPNYNSYMRMIGSITELKRRIRQYESQISHQKFKENELSLVRIKYIQSVNQLRNEITSVLKNCENSEINGVRSAFSNSIIESIIETKNINEVIEASNINRDILFQYYRTIQTLRTYAIKQKWPLEEPWRSKYINSYRKYIRALLSDIPENPDIDSPEQCEQIIEVLEAHQLEIIMKILNLLPNDSIIEATVQRLVDDKKTQINKTKSEIELQLDDLTNELCMLENKLYEMEPPSFTDCFTKESQRERIRSATRIILDSARKYIESGV